MTAGRLARAIAAVLLATGALAGCAEPPASTPTVSAAPSTPRCSAQDTAPAFAALETQFAARLGVYAVDTGSGCDVGYRAGERFGYASTYKALVAGALLADPSVRLDEQLSVPAVTVSHSPVTSGRAGGTISLSDALAAAVQQSDNTAGNLLLDRIGGPEGLAAALRRIGDTTTRPAREEPDLNDVSPGDPADTSTARALAADLRAYAVGDALSGDRRAGLLRWMTGNATGAALIRAGVSADWTVADKSGAAAYGTRNDIAVLSRSGRRPIVLAILSDRATVGAVADDALIASAARVAMSAFGH
jgi:beta-lactamase class A